uniref:Uncharacterized protein n=1 Tax=Siphoviridae sp. ct9lR64 TaxID=2826178 RepID=A0A8S5QX61_9CAUD|nr:MAG TPA: hypothetical protein [Siphoviridae sp. ct9lR64]
MIYVTSGGSGSGSVLTINGVVGSAVTISKSGKTKKKVLDSTGKAIFKGLSDGTWTVTMTKGSQSVTRSITLNSSYEMTIAYFSATITVTYPANSTCTCSDGTTTLTDTNTGATEKTVIFTVPNIGNWVISCMNGTESTSETVSITVDGQTVTVKLTYFDGTIYDVGTVNVEMEMISSPENNYSVTYNASSLTFKYAGNKAAGFLSAKVDVTGYSTLKVSHKGNNSGSGLGNVAINDTNTLAYGSRPKGSSAFNHMNANVNTVSLDISSFTGEYYVGIWDQRWDSGGSSVIVYKIWME